MDHKTCERARLARDPRFDGLFFTGVKSTGIYCRPVCPAPAPRPENIAYFPTADAAAAAGLRPCLRCRPETAPGTPAWNGTSATVTRAMHLIREGALNGGSVADLAERLGLGARHLRRLFNKHVGTTPRAIADNQRILFAKQLITETDMPITQVALAAGYSSLRRLDAAFCKRIGRTPTELRRTRQHTRLGGHSEFHITLQLPYRPPYDWERMLAFFEQRAVAGIERVEGGSYQRTIRLDAGPGTIAVRHAPKGFALALDVYMPDCRELMTVVQRVRRMFDLNANPQAIHQTLARDPLLKRRIDRLPGLRLPGSWDPFETMIRAVVGQQISVKGAVTQVGRLASLAGTAYEATHAPRLKLLFPDPVALATADLTQIGMPRKRKATIRELSRQMANGTLTLDGGVGLTGVIDRLTKIAGIGPWTANYVAMRALSEPDAFPASDLGIIKALQQGTHMPTTRQVKTRAETWRPWRAYAAVYLWQTQER